MSESYFESGVRRPTVTSRPEDSGVVDRRRGGAEKVVAASGTSGTIILDCFEGSIFTLIPTGDVTAVVIKNPPKAGKNCCIQLRVAQGATPRAIATPSGGNFFDTATPTQVANKACWFTYDSVDGGASWDCWASVQV